MKKAMKYYKAFLDHGGNSDNVVNWASHYMYGTSAESLAWLSHRGIVYNPPGHR